MCDVRSRLADVSVHLAHNANVLIAVQKRVFVFSLDAHVARTCVGGFVCLETGVGQDNDQASRIPIVGSYRNMLFGNELRKLGWW